LLLSKGALINVQDCEGTSALLRAAEMYRYDVCKLLLNSGADVNIANKEDGKTVLMQFCKSRQFDLCELALAKGAVVDAQDSNGWTALFYASQKDVCSLLVSHGANVNFRDHEGNTPLHRAALCLFYETCNFLFTNGADVTAVNAKGDTILMNVCHYPSSLNLVSTLLDMGVDLNVLNENGESALHIAAHRIDTLEICKLLCEHGADLPKIKSSIWSDINDLHISKFLFMRGAELGRRNEDRLYFHCVRSNDLEVTKVLLFRGRSISPRTLLFGVVNDVWTYSKRQQSRAIVLTLLSARSIHRISLSCPLNSLRDQGLFRKLYFMLEGIEL
jgi:ankyrin repeat protein